MTLPTAKTLKQLREMGMLAEKTEHWQAPFPEKPGARPRKRPQFGRRIDLFGFGDVLALDLVNRRVVIVQATSAGAASARMQKIATECRDYAAACVFCGVRVEVWGWRELKTAHLRRVWWPKRWLLCVEDGRFWFEPLPELWELPEAKKELKVHGRASEKGKDRNQSPVHAVGAGGTRDAPCEAAH